MVYEDSQNSCKHYKSSKLMFGSCIKFVSIPDKNQHLCELHFLHVILEALYMYKMRTGNRTGMKVCMDNKLL